MQQGFPVREIRARFPGLERQVGDRPAVFLDGPAGSQTPQVVVDELARYMTQLNANVGGCFATSVESDAVLAEAHAAVADLLHAPSPDEVVFGPNMTSLTFMLSSTLARTWAPGDEVVVTRLDHEANVTPWVEAAADAGAVVRHVEVKPRDCTLDLDDLESKLSERTRLVAVTAASNLVGTIPPVARITRMAHQVGALVFVDAVHYAPHGVLDVQSWGCDFLSCSAYKFFGPHVGILWGRADLLASLPARKLHSAPSSGPGRWMNGTQNLEGIAGTAAAVNYLADLGRELHGQGESRRAALVSAFDAVTRYEQELARQLLEGLDALDGFRVHGIAEPSRAHERTPTVAVTHVRHAPQDLVRRLADDGIFAWSGNNYALPLTQALDLEPEGVLRLGLLHYNTAEEVERVLDALARAAA